MALQDTCTTPSAADVAMRYLIDECGCPGVAPADPVKYASLDVGSRALRETRSEVEDPNAYGNTCVVSASDGGEASLPFTFSFCRNRKLLDAALGSKVEFHAAKIFGKDIDGTAATNKYSSTAVDFWGLGYRPGMVVTVSGFSETAFNGVKVILAVDPEGTSPSTMTFYASADTSEYPVPAANDTDETDIAIDPHYVTYQGNEAQNIILEREFPGVLNEDDTEGLFQTVLGAVVENFSETFEPGAFVTGTMDFKGSLWNGVASASLGSLGQEDDCACGDKVMFDPDEGRQVELFFNGALICFTTLQWTLARTNQLQKTSCTKQIVPSKSRATGSLTVPFTDSTFLEKVRDKATGPLTIVIWNDDRSQFETRWFPDVTVATESVDPDDEAPLLQEVTFTANSDPDIDNIEVAAQRSFLSKMPPRNRFETSVVVVTGTDAAKSLMITGGDVGETVTIDWGDGTIDTALRTTTGSQTFTRTYVADGTYDIVAWSDGDAPWTVIAGTGASDVYTDPSFCYLREYLTGINLQLAGTSLIVENMPALTSIDITSATLTSLRILNARPTTVDMADATAMLAAGWDAILLDLVNANVASGTATLTGGAAPPSAAGLADKAILVARGWTVSNN